MNKTFSPKVSKIIYILLSPLNFGIIYLIFKAASSPKADGYEAFLIVIGLLFSLGQILLFMEFFPESTKETLAYQWTQFPVFILIMACFAFIAIFVSVGSGIREFEFKLNGVMLPLPESFGEIGGRIVFGLVGIMIARAAILFAVSRSKELFALQKGKAKADSVVSHNQREEIK